MKARLYEAIDLIVKAWTCHGGSFRLEGEFFHHREVDIVPDLSNSPTRRYGSQRSVPALPRK